MLIMPSTFLNGLTMDGLKNANIKYIISIIAWTRKVVNKYHHLDTVQANIDIMVHQLNIFRDIFDPQLRRDSHFFRRKRCYADTKGISIQIN